MLNIAANISLLFNEYPLLERINAAKSSGFHAIEVQFPYEQKIIDWQKHIENTALPIVLINVPAGDLMSGGLGLACVAGKQSEFRAAVDSALEYAQALAVPTINILSGRIGNQTPEQTYDILAENISWACAHDKNIQWVVEAINNIDMPGFYVSNITILEKICADIPAIKMQIDLYHLARMNIDSLSYLQTHLDRIGHIQFADYPNRHEPGSGSLDFPAMFSWLKDSAYQGFCGAEYRPQTTTEKSLHWLSDWQRY